MSDLVLRALREGEVDLFESLPDPGLVGLAAFGQRYGAMAQEGEYRPEWTWVALREGRVVARAAWWGGPSDDAPRTLDWLDFTDPDAAVALLRAAPFRAEYSLTVPVDWRDHPEVRAAAEGRVDVAQRCGMRLLVERLQYVWTPSAGVPDRPGRLRFRAEPDDLAILDALRRIFVDALDAGIRRDVERLGVAEAAAEELAFLTWLPGPREWWRLAYAPSGDLAGLAVPSRNYAGPQVGLVGVVPEQRGNGYGYELLVECTHLLVAAGAERITATTDTTNGPMAAAFATAGYPVTRHRLLLGYP